MNYTMRVDTKTAKQFRNYGFLIFGLSLAIVVAGATIMISTRSENAMGIILFKSGVGGVLIGYFLALYVFMKRNRQISRATKISTWFLLVLSIPLVYGLIVILFSA